ncbi:MAG: redox-regulated ATPase YchF, partial [Terrimicrobiaceae bacterium]|nr:redox-regulated ATPase YchF [Terrimicrobiaceae bacterium]
MRGWAIIHVGLSYTLGWRDGQHGLPAAASSLSLRLMLKAGIVGLPNVGKSTLFNALTRTRKAQAANFPFCTIEPNIGVVTVPDPRLEVLARMSKSERVVPAAIEFVDIAGLVKGASQGEGLGNQFLSHIREVDAVVQVVRCFESADIHHVTGSVDPVRDIEIIATELILADLASLRKQADRLQKSARGGDKAAKAALAAAEKLLPWLDEGRPALTAPLSPEEQAVARGFFLLSAKPTLFACNVAEDALAGAESLPMVRAVREYAAGHMGSEAVVISAQIESELAELPPEEAREFLAGLGVADSGVSALIRAVYHLLG